jgi:hypothetical protein
MKPTTRYLTTLMLLPAALLTLASCSSPPAPTSETTSSTSIEKGVPGGVVVETNKMTANVTAIDTASRTVTLATPDGRKTPVKCGPEIINFDQIRVGDQVKVTVTEELAVSMATEATPPAAGAMTVALAPKGAKPGGVIAGTVQVTATISAIDLKNHKATLQFPDGSTHTVAVREDVDLTQRKVGEKVVIRTTGSMAISVEKP